MDLSSDELLPVLSRFTCYYPREIKSIDSDDAAIFRPVLFILIRADISEVCQIALIAVESPCSSHHDRLVFIQSITEQLGDNHLREDGEEYFLLCCSIGKKSSTDILIGEINDDAFTITLLNLTFLNANL